MEKRLLALDQASVTSGWSVFINKDLKEYGHITLEDNEIGDRLIHLKKEIIKLIHKYKINHIAFEDIQLQNSVGNNVHTFKVLAEVYGLILVICTELKIDYTIVSSNTWKSTLQIQGKKRAEQKRDAQRYVIENYNIKPTQDEADSICIGTNVIINNWKKTRTFEDEGFNWN